MKDAKSIHGTNPQFLIETIIRSRIYESVFWKDDCFGLNEESICDKAVNLDAVGGVYGGNQKPTQFLSLVLKLLQIQPEREILLEYLKNEDFKYLRALAAYYWRLTASSIDIYTYLEPLLNDYRKLRRRLPGGGYDLTFMDAFIDELLTEERVCNVIMPRLIKRSILEEEGKLEPRSSILDEELEELERSASEPEDEQEVVEEPVESDDPVDEPEEPEEPEEAQKEVELPGDKSKKKFSTKKVSKLFKTTKVSKPPAPQKVISNGDGMSIEETNRVRVSLGLKPLSQ